MTEFLWSIDGCWKTLAKIDGEKNPQHYVIHVNDDDGWIPKMGNGCDEDKI